MDAPHLYHIPLLGTPAHLLPFAHYLPPSSAILRMCLCSCIFWGCELFGGSSAFSVATATCPTQASAESAASSYLSNQATGKQGLRSQLPLFFQTSLPPTPPFRSRSPLPGYPGHGVGDAAGLGPPKEGPCAHCVGSHVVKDQPVPYM